MNNEENDSDVESVNVLTESTVLKGEADEKEEAAPETDEEIEEDEEKDEVCFDVFVVETLLVIVEIIVFEMIGLIVCVLVSALLNVL